MAKRLSEAEVEEALKGLPKWSLEAGKLHREYRFKDFKRAWGFMSVVALAAEEKNHHPEWFNVWATVRVDLTTHDCGGISAKDFALARVMEEIAASFETQ